VEQVALLAFLIFAAVAAVVALLGSVSLWWIYFDRTEEAAREVIFSSDDLGRVALSAYTYFHIPIIVGIIAVGAADELTLAHPGDRTSAALVALTLAVTALALAGHALFKRGIFGVLSWPCMVAIVALITLMPVGFKISALALSGVARLIVVGLVAV
jgi:low temperature requirement protein LtrA